MNIKISIFGDFVAQNSTDIFISSDLKRIIASSDIAVCNFEAPVDGYNRAADRVGPKIKQSSIAPTLLKEWGFNAIQLANNHMLDFGEGGCKDTINAFKDITTIGAGTYEEAYKIKVIQVKTKKVGFLSCVHHEFGVWDSNSSTQKIGTAWICHYLIQKRISEAKETVDYLIVLPHAGVEETDAPIPEWRELYRAFIDWGADAVIGTHPHVPQGWEVYHDKPIFYSLGNFYFDVLNSPHPFWSRSIAVELFFKDNHVSYNVNSLYFKIGYIGEDLCEDRIDYHKYLCSLLNEDRYMEYCNEMARNKWNCYRNWLVRGLGAYSLSLGFVDSLKTCLYSLIKKRPSTLLVNTLQCESHRWTILRAQKYDKVFN